MTNKEIARKIYEDGINSRNLALFERLVSPDYEGADGSRGVAAFRANVERLLTGFPDIRFTVEDVLAEGGRVAVRWSWKATHTGTFAGVAPTHKAITNSGIVIYEIRDGRITRSWLETDRLGALQQMRELSTGGAAARP